MKSCSLLPPFALVLASCQPEALTYVCTVNGEPYYEIHPLSSLELLPFTFFCGLMAVALLQSFIPALRRLYATCFRGLLRVLGKQHKLAEASNLLSRSFAWHLFALGLCLCPLLLALYSDTFRPHMGGPFNFGYALMGAFFSAVLMAAVTIIAGLWTFLLWESLHRVNKENPLARHIATRVLPLLLLLCLLPACKPSVSTLRFIELAEKLPGEDETDLTDEARELVAHYLETGEVNYATPKHGLTMLHLAALTHRLWLVEQLLAEGADPNARLHSKEGMGDTPILLALSSVSWSHPNDDALLIIKALVQHGAGINLEGSSRVLGMATRDYSVRRGQLNNEGLVMELMKLGAKAGYTDLANFTNYGWSRALQALMASPEWPELRQDLARVLHWSAVTFQGESEQLECLKLLLQHATEKDVKGTTQANPLYSLTSDIPTESCGDDGGQKEANYAEFASQLITHGAAPLSPGGEFGRSCAADHIALYPWMVELLQERGHNLVAPAHRLTPGTLAEQLLDIPAGAFRKEELVEQYATIAGIFSAPVVLVDHQGEALRLHHGIQLEGAERDEAMRRGGLRRYREACARALELLTRVDSHHTNALLMALPCWKDPAAWNEGDSLEAARGMLHALQETPGVIIPAQWLVDSARAMEQAGKPEVAHAFVRLLARDPSSKTLVEELCSEATALPLRAAAWCCKLEQEELPAPGSLDDWTEGLFYRVDSERYPEIFTALSAEQSGGGYAKIVPEQIFYVTESPHASDEVLAALRSIGAPLTAAYCGSEATAPIAPEIAEMKEKHGMIVAAGLELELALSRYIWQHRDVFRDPVKCED